MLVSGAMSEAAGAITSLLERHRQGDPGALAELMPVVYDELREIARRQVRKSGAHTLDTTALVHEAYLKLSGAQAPDWADRCHFMAVAATAMRQILVDYARRSRTQKRGSGQRPLTLDENRVSIAEQAETLIAIDRALERLGELDERLSRVVECRFFGGMTEKEIAASLELDERTIRRDWVKARAWLHRELGA